MVFLSAYLGKCKLALLNKARTNTTEPTNLQENNKRSALIFKHEVVFRT
jgi:hypothetical protein